MFVINFYITFCETIKNTQNSKPIGPRYLALRSVRNVYNSWSQSLWEGEGMHREEHKGIGGSAGKIKKKETRGKPRLREASSGWS